MKSMLFIITILTSIFCFGQEEGAPLQERNYVFNLHQYGGIFLNQEPGGEVNFSLNAQIQSKSFFGGGLDYTYGYYRSPNLNDSPPKEIITGYPQDSQDPLPSLKINGTNKHYYMAFSPYVSKEYNLLSFVAIDLQVGPSLVFLKLQEYSYGYNPGGTSFGGFSFGDNSSSISAKSTENKKITIGGYLRAVLKLKLGKVFRLEVSPFANINSVESNIGAQLGVGFRF